MKVGPGKTLPDHISLIPDEYLSADALKEAVFRYAQAWENGAVLSQGVDDLLQRRLPRVIDHASETLIDPGQELLPQVIQLAARLDGTTLCIQGPPGTGKTFTAAAIIAQLLRRGSASG